MKIGTFVVCSLLFVGCAIDRAPEESEIGGASEALQRRSGGGGTMATCPGGGQTACVSCLTSGCTWTCNGGYTCGDGSECRVDSTNCRTSLPSVYGYGGGIHL